MSTLAERLDRLSPDRRALLERRLMDRQTAAEHPIPRRAANAPAPVSYSQKLMWLAHGLVQERSTYNTPIPIRMRGHLNIGALRRTLDTIVERHEVLRT